MVHLCNKMFQAKKVKKNFQTNRKTPNSASQPIKIQGQTAHSVQSDLDLHCLHKSQPVTLSS